MLSVAHEKLEAPLTGMNEYIFKESQSDSFAKYQVQGIPCDNRRGNKHEH